MTDLQHNDLTEQSSRAIAWFQHSGIQEANGGVARYHLLAEGRNLSVSTEITGYAVSAMVWGGAFAEACRAADFLVYRAWQPDLQAMPFEVGNPMPPSYFFDCGIIVRGLLAAWRASGRLEYLGRAREIGLAMGRDFWSAKGELHPILELPSKMPRAYEKRWSREPGCLQLKSALAWADLAKLFPGEAFAAWFERALHYSLQTHLSFLPGEADEHKVMDRLHAYSYFLEALLARAARTEVKEALCTGIGRVGHYLREIGPCFERSDVCAQLLRVRLLADSLGAVPIAANEAEEEATRCAAHQRCAGPPMTDGGYGFGTRDGAPLPYMNPVSTAFCMQAMQWWHDWKRGAFQGSLAELI
ncbi:MAG: hypothetical protein HYX27_11485 [Acidobacteria bacterium]|nr:hypothetical protein [Acidobacteriota bacterium]